MCRSRPREQHPPVLREELDDVQTRLARVESGQQTHREQVHAILVAMKDLTKELNERMAELEQLFREDADTLI